MSQTNSEGVAGPGHEYARNSPTPADRDALASQPKGSAPIDNRGGRPFIPLKSDVDRTPFHPTPMLNPLQMAGELRDHAYVDKSSGQLAYHDNDVASYIKPVADLLATTYSALEALGEFKAAAHQDGTLSEGQAVLKIAESAERVQLSLAKRWDNVTATLDKQVKHLENELAKPIKASADRPGIAEQVRTHFKTMALDQRLPALRALIANGDTESASAILGAPAFLSGFETFKPEVMGPVVKELNAKMQPTVAKRLDAVRAASDFLGKRSYLNTECVRVIGVSPNRLSKLRAGKSESERARALLDSRIGIAGI